MQRSAGIAHPAFLALAAALAAHLLLVWAFPFFPTIDGPAHVHLGYGMGRALAGDPFYAEFFRFNERVPPNLLAELALMALSWLVPPLVAEKILLSLYFTAFAAAAWFAVRAVQPAAAGVAVLLLYCSVSFPLAFGFYNFSFSTVLLLAWLGYWWRTRLTARPLVVVGHGAFAAVCYATHIFALGAALLAIGAVGLGVVVRDALGGVPDGPRGGRWWRGFLRTHVLPPLAGSLPVLVLAAGFLLSRGGQTRQAVADLGALHWERLAALLAGRSFAAYGVLDAVPAAAFVIVLAVALYLYARRGGRFHKAIPFGVGAAVFALVYLLMPSQVLVRWMPMRFQPLVFVMLLLWLAALTPPRGASGRLAAVGLALVIAAGVVRWDAFARLNDRFGEFVSVADRVAPHSTLVALRLSDEGAGAGPFIQAGSHLATLTDSVDLKNFQGMAPSHPIQFAPGRSAYGALGGDAAIVAVPPRVDLMAYERRTGRRIDYVLLWGEPPSGGEDAVAALVEQVEANYDLVAVSRPRGLQRLYRRRE